MGDATWTADAMLDLALAPNTSPVARLLMFAAERGDVEGIAKFEHDELRALMAEGVETGVSVAGLRRHIDVAAGHGHIVAGSTMRRIVLDVDRIRPHGDMLVPGDVRAGLRLVHVLDRGRAVAECVACLVRRVYSGSSGVRVHRVWSLCGAGEGCGMSRPCVLTWPPGTRRIPLPLLSEPPLGRRGERLPLPVCPAGHQRSRLRLRGSAAAACPPEGLSGGTCSTSCTMRRAATR